MLHSSSTNLWMCITPLSPPLLSGLLELLMLTHLCVFFPGVGLLVPHGAVAENMSWEMYMVINQGETRWGQSLPKYHFRHLSVCQSPSILSSISPDAPSSVLAVPFLSNYSPSLRYFRYSCEHLVGRTFKSQDIVVFPEADYKVTSLIRSITGVLITTEIDRSVPMSTKNILLLFIVLMSLCYFSTCLPLSFFTSKYDKSILSCFKV